MDTPTATSSDRSTSDPGSADSAAPGSGRLPSLAAQTPGLDTEQEARTLRDAATYYAASDAWGSRHILVPLDGSHLTAALPYAVALARAADARISLLAIVESPPERAGLPSAAEQEGDERRVTESTAYLESVAIPLRARGLAVTTVVRHGNPANEILADSEDEECSLIVMSTHGRTGLERVRVGSVAQHVLRHAVVPTLVVPPGNDPSTQGDQATPKIGSGVTLRDDPTTATTAVAATAQIATQAYTLYEHEGHHDGHAVQDWLQAEKNVQKDESPT